MYEFFIMLLTAAGLGFADRVRGGFHAGLDGFAKKWFGRTVKVLMGAAIALACGVTDWRILLACAALFRLSQNTGYGTPIGIYLSDIPLEQALPKNPEFCERMRQFLGASRTRIAQTPLISLGYCGAIWGLPFLLMAWADTRLMVAFWGYIIAMPAAAMIAKRAHPKFPPNWGPWPYWEIYRSALVGLACAFVGVVL